MDPVSAIGLASAILSFITFSHHVLARLAEFNSNINGIPKSLQGLKTELPLLIDVFDRVEKQTSSGYHEKFTRLAVKSVLDRCNDQVNKLERILEETLPPPGAGWVDRSVKALKSLDRDEKLQEIEKELDRCKQTLILHQVTGEHRNERNGMRSFFALF